MIPRLPLRIHCWGGFGSQIFALLQYKNLSILHPKRNVELIFHSSGVTKRPVEIEPFLTDIPWREIDDFVDLDFLKRERKPLGIKTKVRTKLLSILKAVLLRLGLIVQLESNEFLKRIRPWTSSVRGHYSKYEYSGELFLSFFSELERLSILKEPNLRYSKIFVIQYRLGDLLSLRSKGHIPLNVVRREINNFIETDDSKIDILFLTDSPDSIEGWRPDLAFDFESANLPPIDTLFAGVQAKMFLGTNSKLSLLIATIRTLTGKESILPNVFEDQIRSWTAGIEKVRYYTMKSLDQFN